MTVPSRAEAHDKPICGAMTRAGTPCRRPAGWGTANAGNETRVGVGRCKLNGGRSPVRHGRYSKIKREELRDLIAQYEADPDPLNLLPELAAVRALFHDFVDRYEETTAALLVWHESVRNGREDRSRRPRQVLDIADAQRLVSEITKIAKRIEDVKAHNSVSQADFYRVLGEMGLVVNRNAEIFFEDPERRGQFLSGVRDGWLGIRL